MTNEPFGIEPANSLRTLTADHGGNNHGTRIWGHRRQCFVEVASQFRLQMRIEDRIKFRVTIWLQRSSRLLARPEAVKSPGQ